ncbi:hypothetical protein ABK040_004670 [Willaertia magna]
MPPSYNSYSPKNNNSLVSSIGGRITKLFFSCLSIITKPIPNSFLFFLEEQYHDFPTFWHYLMMLALGSSSSIYILKKVLTKKNSNDNNNIKEEEVKKKVYGGIRNEGATCYLNSLLQTLFHIPLFRKSVFYMVEDNKGVDSISEALAILFYELQNLQLDETSHNVVSTNKLTKSFGWSGREVFEQHDIQEVARILLEDLQKKMGNTRAQKTIDYLFNGTCESVIECINIKYKSSRVEHFHDIQLDVKGCKDIYQSFDKYIKSEILDGDNMYNAENHGLQKARKYINFKELPRVLMLHLKRFDFTQFGTLQKISDMYEFYQHIDLTKYVKNTNSKRSKSYEYTLHAVLIHKGSSVESGHYVVAINVSEDITKQEWYLFDDAKATPISSIQAIDANFGGAFSTAYMLVYIRNDVLGEVLKPVLQEDVPTFLKTKAQQDSSCTIL